MPGELEGNRHEPTGLVLGPQIDRLGPLTGEAIDGRLRIEQIGPERSAVHEELDDPLGPWPEVRRGRRLGGLCILRQQLRESQSAKATTERLDHFTARIHRRYL